MKTHLLRTILLMLFACLTTTHAAAHGNESTSHGSAKQESPLVVGCDDDRQQDRKRWWECRDEKDHYSIYGKVIDSYGVTITVTDSKQTKYFTVTDRHGRFRVSKLRPGSYTVTPSQDGYVFEPSEATVTIVRSSLRLDAFKRTAPNDGLSPDDALRIDSEPETPSRPEDTILPNGRTLREYAEERGIDLETLTNPPPEPNDSSSSRLPLDMTRDTAALAAADEVTGPQQRKNDVITRMLGAAESFACGRDNPPCTKWDHAADPTDPVNKPAQQGLTYIYGGKDPHHRTKPVDGCSEMTYGLDCSGLISLVASAGGLRVSGTAANQGVASNWTIPADWGLEMSVVSDGSIESGDILGWGSHIGIATGSGRVISSTGSPGQCARNIAPPRGPRSLTISQLGLGTPQTVLRLVADLTGDWDMYIRCADQTTDAAVIRFTIQNEGGGAFTATGNGTDYNGAPLSFILTGTYNVTANVVSATLALTDGTRSDSFTQRLLADDTGYFPLTKVIDNGGCFGAARLVRVPASAERVAPQSIAPPMGSSPTSTGSRLGGPPVRSE